MNNQRNDVIGLAIASFVGGILVTLGTINTCNRKECDRCIDNDRINQGYIFVWNDDCESIPNQGYVKVDTIDNNIVYLSPDE